MKRVTLSDIAKETGYSVNTVSHALKDKTDISEKTREYIKSVANSLGYVGNASASFMRSGKSQTVAIIVPDISNPHFSIMIKEMQVALSNAGYTSILFNTDEDEEIEKGAIRTSLGKNVDGIIICPVQKTTAAIDALIDAEIPYVLIGRNYDDNNHNYVVCDNVNGGFVAGCRAIAEADGKNVLFFNGEKHITTSNHRLQGIMNAFEAQNVSTSKLKVFEISPLVGEKTPEIAEILSSQKDYGAVVCFSDLVAMQVCLALGESGVKIPQDVSVIGFDDICSKFYLPLPLSSVSSSKTLMSTKAVEILLGVIDNDSNTQTKVILPTKLHFRKTTKNLA